MEQRSEAWHSLRKKKIGASDAGAILGFNPDMTAHDVWLSKQEGYVGRDNPAMRQGRDREDEALRLFEQESGYLMSPKVMISDVNPWMMASLDGFDAIEGNKAVEVKCPFSDKGHISVLYGEIPKHYYAQMQHQMFVAELDEIYFCSYRPEYDIKPLYFDIVKRDIVFIVDMIEKECKFYEEHMITGTPPENPDKTKIMDCEEWKTISNQYKQVENQIKNLEKTRENIRECLILLCDAENAKGNGIILTKVERKGIIPYQNIPEIKTMDLEKHRKPSTSYWQVKEANET